VAEEIMKKRVISIVALSLSFTTGVLVGGSSHSSSPGGTSRVQALDPAFRDGLYQAKLDTRNGKPPHFSTGRWSSESARASFIAGYEEGYRDSANPPAGAVEESSIAQQATSGFRDGLLDGALHRLASRPFQADQTAHYRNAGLLNSAVPTNGETFQDFYREAYLHGYKQAYYSSSKGQ